MPKGAAIFDAPVHGIIRQIDAEDLPETAAVDLRNVVLDEPMQAVSRRPGSQRFGPTKTPLGNASWNHTAKVLYLRELVLDDGTVRELAVVRTGTGDACLMYSCDPTSATAPRAWTLIEKRGEGDDSFDVVGILSEARAVVYKGLLILAHGKTGKNLVVTDGATWDYLAEMDAPDWTGTVTPTGSGSMTGTYNYVVTLFDAVTGSESVTAGPKTATPSANAYVAVTFTGISLDEGQTLRLYRTTDGGDVYRLLTEQATTAAYNDGKADSELGYDTPPEQAGNPPDAAQFAFIYHDRLWLLVENMLYFSEPLQPANFGAFHFLPVGPDDGDLCTGVGTIGGVPVVTKAKHVYQLAGSTSADYALLPLLSGTGIVAHGTIREVEGRLFGLSLDGPIALAGRTPDVLVTQAQEIFSRKGERSGKDLVTVHVRQNDIVTETFHFRARLYSDAACTQLFATYQTTTDQSRWTAYGNPFPAAGVSLAPGQGVHVTFKPAETVAYPRYYAKVDTWDGHEWSNPVTMTLAGAGQFLTMQGINWSMQSDFWALVNVRRREYWLFLASQNSDIIDTVLVLNYRTGHLVFYDIHATQGCVVEHVELEQRGSNDYMLLGDSNGCTWIQGIPDVADRNTLTEDSMADRSGAGTFAGLDGDNAPYFTLADATAAWPTGTNGVATDGLKGEQVVLVDASGFAYTGLIVGNTATVLTLRRFLGGRSPAPGNVTYAIGAVNAEITTRWFSVGREGRVQFLDTLLHIQGASGTFSVELRGSDSADDQTHQNWQRWRKRSFSFDLAPPAGRSQMRRFLHGTSGDFVQFRFRCIEPFENFILRSFGGTPLAAQAVEA